MAGCADRPVGVNAGCKPGLVRLRQALLATYPSLRDWGCFNPRSRTDGGGWSLHAEGRAIDLGVTSTQAIRAADEVFAWCVRNADGIGLQEVIWAAQVWSARNPTVRRYGGSPHHDHVHIGLCWRGALGLTPWFGAPPQPRPVEWDPAAVTRWIQAARKARRAMIASVWWDNYLHLFWVADGALWHRYADREPAPRPPANYADGRENMTVRYNVRETLRDDAGVLVDVLPGDILHVTTRTVRGDLIVWRYHRTSGWGTGAVRVTR